MQTIEIIHRHNKAVLFSGRFDTVKACLEEAVRANVRLDYADLSHTNLSNAQLDEAAMEHADFSFSNLTGANLSECRLQCGIFEGCDLYNVCFAYSDLSGCVFSNASFGGTDIAGVNLTGASFSTLSCFSLPFIKAQTMQACHYLTADGMTRPMNNPPVVIQGLTSAPIILFEDAAYAGEQILHDRNFLAVLKIQT